LSKAGAVCLETSGVYRYTELAFSSGKIQYGMIRLTVAADANPRYGSNDPSSPASLLLPLPASELELEFMSGRSDPKAQVHPAISPASSQAHPQLE
jgi:hypothetical protein